MSDFICPNCRGGFPDPETLGECPWCGQGINGSYEAPEPGVGSIRKVQKRGTERSPTLLDKLLGRDTSTAETGGDSEGSVNE